MKCSLLILFLLILVSNSHSQSQLQKWTARDKHKDGKHFLYYSNRSIYLEYETLDGQLIGTAKNYNEDGSIFSSEEYQDGKLHGTEIWCQMEGTIIKERRFSNDSIVFEKEYFYDKDTGILLTEWVWDFYIYPIKR